MAYNVTETKLLDELHGFHNSVFSVESIAESMDLNRQDIAPYFSKLVNDGIIVALMSSSFSHVNTLRAAGKPVQAYAFSCFALNSKPQELIWKAYSIAFESLAKRLGHESIIPSGIRFHRDWFAIVEFNRIPWIIDNYICEICDFNSNSHIRLKTGGPIKKAAQYFLAMKKEGVVLKRFPNYNYNSGAKIEEVKN